jgi:ribosomal protein L19E
MTRIRSQRNFIRELKDGKVITNETYREIYRKSKGGFFRSTRHIKIYLEDNKLFLAKTEQKQEKSAKPKKQTINK